MARARNIKPGFFSNDELSELDPLARLLFIGLWTVADREGRLEDRPKRIKAEILPYDDCDIDKLLEVLALHQFIIRYIVDGQGYIFIPTFKKHQNPHLKEPPSTIPAPVLHQCGTSLAPDKNSSCTSLAPDKYGAKPILLPDNESTQNDSECANPNEVAITGQHQTCTSLAPDLHQTCTIPAPVLHQCGPADSGFPITDSPLLIPETTTDTMDGKNCKEEKETRVVVFEYLTKNICPVSNQVEADTVGDWIETMPRDWIIEAIKQAALSKARSIKYVDKILQAWVAKYKLDEKPWEVEADGGNRKNGLQVSHRRDPTADEYERDRSRVGWGD